MKSKDAIRNTILAYTNQIWGVKKVERLDPLIQMMVEALTNELYLIQNKLNDIDASLLEKIAQRLTPEKYTSIRPAHTILRIKPNYHTLLLEQSNPFTLEWLPDKFVDRNVDTVLFHPVTDTYLHNIKIENLFYYNRLYFIDNNGHKKIATDTRRMDSNSVWLGISVGPEIKNLKGVSFFIDFPKLSEIDELYEILSYIKCFINGKEVPLKQGFPLFSKEQPTGSDRDILLYYNDHYLTIEEILDIKSLKAEKIPSELKDIIDTEAVEEMDPKYWIKLQFLPYFTADILKDITIDVNTFPVSNKKLLKTTVIQSSLSKITTLPTGSGEKLLFVDAMVDNRGRDFVSDMIADNSGAGTYHIEITNSVFIEELTLADYVEQLLDLIDDERTVFSGINRDMVTLTLSSLTEMRDKVARKVDSDYRDKKSVARLSVNPYENTISVNVDYWATYGKDLNNIPAGKAFAPDKTTKLNGLMAVSLCEVHGAREFSDIQDIMSINKYIFTSKDRIVTEHDIKCFCESELGQAVEKVEVGLGEKISPKPREGIIRVIDISLTPSAGTLNSLYQKGFLKSLKVRLQERSSADYIYNIKISKL